MWVPILFVCRISLLMLCQYLKLTFILSASKKVPAEVPKLAECVADVRALLQHILSDRLPPAQVKPSFSGIAASSSTSALLGNYLQSVLDECHETFLACYHAFYPSSQLKWRGLCDLLLTIDVVSAVILVVLLSILDCLHFVIVFWLQSNLLQPWVEESMEGDHLLAAVLASLCASSIRLTSTLPVSLESDFSELSPLSPEPNHDATSPVASNGQTQEMSPGITSSEVNKYPVLVECVTVRSEVSPTWEILNTLSLN